MCHVRVRPVTVVVIRGAPVLRRVPASVMRLPALPCCVFHAAQSPEAIINFFGVAAHDKVRFFSVFSCSSSDIAHSRESPIGEVT